MSASAGGGVPRDRDEELEEEEDLEGEYDEEDDGNNSDSEAFMSARDNTSDWYQEMRRMGHSAESPMGTARSTEQFWTPRDVATEGPTVAECEAANTFRPNLMPKEFEKIFSKTRNGRYKEVESLMEKGEWAPAGGGGCGLSPWFRAMSGASQATPAWRGRAHASSLGCPVGSRASQAVPWR